MESEKMPIIVNPRPFTPSAVRDSTLRQQFTKKCVNSAQSERPSARSRKEDRIGRPVAEMVGILAQSVHQGQCRRNQSIFAELSLPDSDDALIEVDVSNT